MWNLVEHLSQGSQRRFSPPLVNPMPGQTGFLSVDADVYTFGGEPVNTNILTRKYPLTVNIAVPAGGFSDNFLEIDPLIRLSAMGNGLVYFKVDDLTGINQLELILTDFGLMCQGPGFPAWWDRWVSAGLVPRSVVIENVRADILAGIVNLLPADPSITINGLRLPDNVSALERQNYIDEFLSGASGHFIYAEAGALLGEAGFTNQNASLPSQEARGFNLYAYYHGHSEASPLPMNPVELFALLFGDDSAEAQNHPFLLRMHQTGLQQTTVHPLSRRKTLRPPLRTWKRVVWEAENEKVYKDNWKPSGVLGKDRLYNSHQRANRSYNQGEYKKNNKCNLFVSDVCLRAGFRTCIHPVNPGKWHYMDANSFTNHVHRTPLGPYDSQPLLGVAEDKQVVWSRKIENRIRSLPVGERQARLNADMQEDGRCYILAGARQRKFVDVQIEENSPVYIYANCKDSLRVNGIGHIVIVRELNGQPQLAATPGEGLTSLSVSSLHASDSGAVQDNYFAQLGGSSSNAAGEKGFIRLHLLELEPGGDPDTLQGLRDLNVLNTHPNLLKTLDERAVSRKLTHNPDGSLRSDGPCCQDHHPVSDIPTEEPC